MNSFRTAIAGIVVVLFALGCAPGIANWDDTRRADSAASYHRFLREYPNAPQVAEARERLAFARLRKKPTAEGYLNRTEIDHLAFAGWLMSMESGIRFLTDHLRGDTYFKVHRDGHNVDRCRMQLKLAAEIELGEQAMRRIVDLAAP